LNVPSMNLRSMIDLAIEKSDKIGEMLRHIESELKDKVIEEHNA